MNGPFFPKPMKPTEKYSPQISISKSTIEDLISLCHQAVNHSYQTEVWISNAPHDHARQLRKALTTISAELNKQTKWINVYSRVGEITEELDQINQEDKDKYLPDQKITELHDLIDEFVGEAEKCFDYEPTDEELANYPGVTARERAEEAWQQKMEAKG